MIFIYQFSLFKFVGEYFRSNTEAQALITAPKVQLFLNKLYYY